MTDVVIEAGMLTANHQDRVVSGLLLPYGEVGRTNLGRFSVPSGVVKIPADPSVVTLNIEHTREEPVGRAMTLTETSAGVVGTFSIARTPEGDKYLADVEAGKRNSLSAEVSGIVLRSGQAVAGRLFGAAACVAGAFPSATLLASDVGEIEDALEEAVEAITEAAEAVETQTPEDDQPSDNAVETAGEESPVDEDQTVETVEDDENKTLHASAPRSLKNPGKSKGNSLFATLGGNKMPQVATMLAALDQIIPSDALPAQESQWLGEIYASRTYERRFAPLIQHADLQALQAIGWKFTDGKTPAVADYAGYPAQPNSNEVKTEQVTLSASRIAGAGSVDRAFLDFPTPEFWAGYFREQTNSYERTVDGKVPALLAGGATAVTADAVPSGVSTAASYIVDGAAAILDNERGMPSFAIVGTALWKGLLRTRSDDTLAYLSAALGLEDGTLEGFKILPSSQAAFTGKVLVGTKTAATLYELPGSPVRVDTVNISNGGVERGTFGYWAGLVNDAKGLALVASA